MDIIRNKLQAELARFYLAGATTATRALAPEFHEEWLQNAAWHMVEATESGARDRRLNA